MSIIVDGKELSQQDCIDRVMQWKAEDERRGRFTPKVNTFADEPGDDDELKAAKKKLRDFYANDFEHIYSKMKADNSDLRPGQVMALAIQKHPAAHQQWLADVRNGLKSGKLEA
ncbi:MAG: hypothetical protein WAW22_12190 [Smithellaceae bacterium]